MEKKTAHYLLADVKALVQRGCVMATRSALEGAAALGYSFDDMVEVVKNLEIGDLYKSMTTIADHKIWQDVYHYPAQEADIYIKIQVVEGVVIVSFKEL